jgi:hypothetical protein
MRDYSLHEICERLAVKGEILVTYRFRNRSIGLVSPVEIAAARGPFWKRLLNLNRRSGENAAVRVSPGTRLRVNAVPDELCWEFGVGASEDVTFVELSAEKCHYRHAIRFRNGRHVLLQRFGEGVSFKVIADGSKDRNPDEEPEEPQRLNQPVAERFAGAFRL